MQAAEHAQSTESYIDAHAWQFTPSSFRLMVLELSLLGVIDLHESEVVDTIGCEFFIGLCKGRATHSIPSRLELAEQAMIEQATAVQRGRNADAAG